jgi:hypothetical protein
MLPNRHAPLQTALAVAAGLAVVLWGGAVRAAGGVLDLPAPLFSGVDGLLSGWLPLTVRLLLWAVVAAVASMALYRLTSNQPRLAAIKAEMAALRTRIAGFDGPFAAMWGLVRRNLVLALRQLWVTLVPAILASVPVIFLLVWVSNSFDLALPQPGDPVEVEALARTGDTLPPLHWVPGDGVRAHGDGRWTVTWPAAGAALQLRASDQLLLTLPLAAPVGVVHQHRWWNRLLGNPAGYLPPGEVAAVDLALPARSYLPFGPAWLRGWMPLFFAVVLAVSLLLKLAWRLH